MRKSASSSDGPSAGVRTRVDPCRRLADELLERDRRILAPAKPIGPRLDEVAHEWPVLVERRAVRARVLLECKRQCLPVVLELAQEVRERAEHECAKRVVELWRANGHALPYAPPAANPRSDGSLGGPGTWHLGHQYAVRFRSPRPRELIGVPQRDRDDPHAGRRPERAVHPPPPSHRRLAHASAARELLTRHLRSRPRRQATVPEELGEPHVPDPGDEPLVEERIAEETRAALGGPHSARARRVRRVREQIRAETEVGAGREPERRAVPESRLELGAAQDEPRPAE